MMNTNSPRAKKVIRNEYHDSTNVMTPDVCDYVLLDDFAVEVSKGRSLIRDKEMYGVSVVERDGEEALERRVDLCKAFFDEEEAYEYIENVVSYADTKQKGGEK